MTITNQGNVPSAGLTTITIYASPDGIAAGTQLVARPYPLRIRPGRSIGLRIPIPAFASLPAGSYFLVANVIDSSGKVESTSWEVRTP